MNISEVHQLTPGNEMRKLLAIHVLDYRWFYVSPDSSGKNGSHILIPWEIEDLIKSGEYALPPGGMVPESFYYRPWDMDIAEAWKIINRLVYWRYRPTISRVAEDEWCCAAGEVRAYGSTAPLAICRAALLVAAQRR